MSCEELAGKITEQLSNRSFSARGWQTDENVIIQYKYCEQITVLKMFILTLIETLEAIGSTEFPEGPQPPPVSLSISVVNTGDTSQVVIAPGACPLPPSSH